MNEEMQRLPDGFYTARPWNAETRYRLRKYQGHFFYSDGTGWALRIDDRAHFVDFKPAAPTPRESSSTGDNQ